MHIMDICLAPLLDLLPTPRALTMHMHEASIYRRTVAMHTRGIAMRRITPFMSLHTTVPPGPSVSLAENDLIVNFPSHKTSRFPFVWLRDHSRDPSSFHSATKQRLVDTASIPLDIRPENIQTSTDGVNITWDASTTSFFPWSFLAQKAYNPPVMPHHDSYFKREKVLWNADAGRRLPALNYSDIMSSEQGVWEWLSNIDTYGVGLVRGVPHEDALDTKRLLERIAFIRETHYGGFYDFTADGAHGDLAYSTVYLGAHTDTTYFTDPAGLQAFHQMAPRAGQEGGDNLLVDAFYCAKVLRERDPDAYNLLSVLPIPAKASGSGSQTHPSGIYITPKQPKPAFEHDEHGQLIHVRWNPEDRDVLGLSSPLWRERMLDFYRAAQVWESILRDGANQLWSVMHPGYLFIFDNSRVMHGRSAFSGTRRISGAYINGDDYRSRLRVLDRKFGSHDRLKKDLNALGTSLYAKGDWSDY